MYVWMYIYINFFGMYPINEKKKKKKKMQITLFGIQDQGRQNRYDRYGTVNWPYLFLSLKINKYIKNLKKKKN